MAIITSGTPIKKVLSGGTPIQKVMSQGTVIWTSVVMITITIPVITGVATQTLKVSGTTIYSGAGGTTVQVEQGSSVAITTTAATGYESPTVTTPVTANSNFSTASYITAGRRIWNYTFSVTGSVGSIQQFDVTGLLINKSAAITLTLGTEYNGGTGSANTTGTISTTTDTILCSIAGIPATGRASVTLSITTNGKLDVKLNSKGAGVQTITISGEIRQ